MLDRETQATEDSGNETTTLRGMSIHQCSRLLGISLTQLLRLIHDGHLRAIKLPCLSEARSTRTKYLLLESEVRRFLSTHSTTSGTAQLDNQDGPARRSHSGGEPQVPP